MTVQDVKTHTGKMIVKELQQACSLRKHGSKRAILEEFVEVLRRLDRIPRQFDLMSQLLSDGLDGASAMESVDTKRQASRDQLEAGLRSARSTIRSIGPHDTATTYRTLCNAIQTSIEAIAAYGANLLDSLNEQVFIGTLEVVSDDFLRCAVPRQSEVELPDDWFSLDDNQWATHAPTPQRHDINFFCTYRKPLGKAIRSRRFASWRPLQKLFDPCLQPLLHAWQGRQFLDTSESGAYSLEEKRVSVVTFCQFVLDLQCGSEQWTLRPLRQRRTMTRFMHHRPSPIVAVLVAMMVTLAVAGVHVYQRQMQLMHSQQNHNSDLHGLTTQETQRSDSPLPTVPPPPKLPKKPVPFNPASTPRPTKPQPLVRVTQKTLPRVQPAKLVLRKQMSVPRINSVATEHDPTHQKNEIRRPIHRGDVMLRLHVPQDSRVYFGKDNRLHIGTGTVRKVTVRDVPIEGEFFPISVLVNRNGETLCDIKWLTLKGGESRELRFGVITDDDKSRLVYSEKQVSISRVASETVNPETRRATKEKGSQRLRAVATLMILMPKGATVYLGKEKKRYGPDGSIRTFRIPNVLTKGQAYSIAVHVDRYGKHYSKTKSVTLRGGEMRVTTFKFLDFLESPG